MDSEEIREAVFSDSENSVVTELRNLSDSGDPSIHLSDFEIDSEDSQCTENENSDIEANARPSTSSQSIISDGLPQTIQPSTNRPTPTNNYGPLITWHPVTGNLNIFDFVQPPNQTGLNADEVGNLVTNDVFKTYSLFIDDEILDLIVLETNRYAEQRIIQAIMEENTKPNAVLVNWADTNRNELLTFVGLLIWMGLDKKPKLRDYWSQNVLYSNKVSKVMSRNRFEALMSLFHASNNETAARNDRLYKVSDIIDKLVRKFQIVMFPSEEVCIDESMVPFRGRLKFRQYIPGKRHKYGIKVFKLCLKGGYTWNLSVYAGSDGAEATLGESKTTSVVLKLMQPILDTGRTLYTDNFYSSVDLAHKLNQRKTHLVGTLRKKRKHNPDSVTKAKLKKGELVAKQSSSKLIVGKWRDKREVLFITSKHVPEMVEIQTKRGPKLKPSTIVE